MLRADRGGWPYGHPPNADFVLNTLSPQARGLLAWYPLGPGQYGITRDALNRHHMTPYAGPVRVGGSRGAVASFTKASSQYLAHAGEAFLDYPFTMTAWFRYLAAPVNFGRDVVMAVSDRDDGYDRDQMSLNNVSGTVWLDALSTTDPATTGACRQDITPLTLGTWYHGVAVFAATDYRMAYVNTVSAWAANTTNVAPTTRDTIAIGSAVRSGGPAYYPDAEIADARIYNRALTLQEIKQLYRNPWELYQPVVRWWVGAALGGGGETGDVTLARTMAAAAGGQAAAEAAMTLALSRAVSQSAEAAALDDLTLALTRAATADAVVTQLADLTLALTRAVANGATAAALGALGLGRSAAVVDGGAAAAGADVSLGRTGGITDAGLAGAVAGLNLGRTGGLTDAALAAALAAVGLGRTDGLTTTGTAEGAAEASLTLTLAAGLVTSARAEALADVDLAVARAVGSGATAETLADLTLAVRRAVSAATADIIANLHRVIRVLAEPRETRVGRDSRGIIVHAEDRSTRVKPGG